MDELRLSVSTLHVDVVIITETWLHEDIDNGLLHIANFDLLRCDRVSRKGGGVCMWIKSVFKPYVLVPTSCLSYIEVSFVLFFCDSVPVICSGIYIPPGLSKSDHEGIVDYLI